jgi:hypothetical protein
MEGLRKLPAVLRLNRAANLVRWICHRRHIRGGNIWIESRRIIKGRSDLRQLIIC